MPKKTASQNRRSRRSLDEPDWMPLSALGGLVGGFFVAYIIAEAALGNSIHPLHWVVAAAGAAAGYLVGLLYTRMKAAP